MFYFYPDLALGNAAMLLLTITLTAMFGTVAHKCGSVTGGYGPVAQGIGYASLGLVYATFVVLRIGLSFEIYEGHSEVGSSDVGKPSQLAIRDPESETYGPCLPLPSALQSIELSVRVSTIDHLDNAAEEDSYYLYDLSAMPPRRCRRRADRTCNRSTVEERYL
ncbi:hypothetical protein EV702DRAFT_1078997 [Suillus placidus]|uniref:Uncharacterized protein n=1 Tax=Suillus placidus TaxID=48579 RepID=A0A9P7A2K5_9AGAM|nr:hypothetical protein EV702DRAFT_1078997 [Suillus placidus]